MQKTNYRSTNYHDIKVAFKKGYEYFRLECPEESAETYITSIESEFPNLIIKKPFYDVNAVSVALKVEVKEVKTYKLMKYYKKIIQGVCIGAVCFSGMILGAVIFQKPKPLPTPEPSKSIVVQDHIIPRECYITHTQTETGWYIWVNDINSDFEVYIEVPDYKVFIDEYLTKSKL